MTAVQQQAISNCGVTIGMILNQLTELKSKVTSFVHYDICDASSTDLDELIQQCSETLNSVFVNIEKIGKGINQFHTSPSAEQDDLFGFLLYSGEDSELYDDTVDALKWQTKAREAADVIECTLRAENVNLFQRHPQFDVTDLRRFGRSAADCDASVTTEVLSFLESVATALSNADKTDGMMLSFKRKGDCFIEMTISFPSYTIDVLIRGYFIEGVRVHLTENRRYPNEASEKVCRYLEQMIRAGSWYFCDLHSPEHSAKTFLLWLRKLMSFPSARCMICGKTIDAGLPPLWRDVNSTECYHMRCRFDPAPH